MYFSYRVYGHSSHAIYWSAYMSVQHSFTHCSKDLQITRNKNALWLSQSIGACCQFPEEGEETGSCFSSPSQAGLIEKRITVLDTKVALGPWQELGNTAQRSRCLLGPPQNSWGCRTPATLPCPIPLRPLSPLLLDWPPGLPFLLPAFLINGAPSRVHWIQTCSRGLKSEAKVLVTWSCLTLCDPIRYSPPGSSVHGILQEEYWSGLPCPSPGYFPDSVITPRSPALKADSLPSDPPAVKKAEHWRTDAFKL